MAASRLEQLAAVTTLSIDTGDLDVIVEYAKTGSITDATTNPLFVSQAGLSGDERYVAFVDAAVRYAKANADGDGAVLELAMDRLAVELGLEIVKLVPGYVSTEVDIRESFNTAESLRRARRIIAMYEAEGVDRSRVLVKLAGTWEGIQAARELELDEEVLRQLNRVSDDRTSAKRMAEGETLVDALLAPASDGQVLPELWELGQRKPNESWPHHMQLTFRLCTGVVRIATATALTNTPITSPSPAPTNALTTSPTSVPSSHPCLTGAYKCDRSTSGT